MSNTLYFKASTNIKNLIGKDLVTDQMTAVFELVKNSYDADATEVKIEFYDLQEGNGRIVISDNGTGMDLEDIEKKWMVIGTESKKGFQYSERFGRPINGDKGIGRFSVDRLGKKLSLNANKENLREGIIINFDWTVFENSYTELDQIKIPFKIYKLLDKTNHGLTLEISELRDDWTKANLSRLIKSLRQLKSPLNIDDNFKITVHAPEYDIIFAEIKPYNLEEISSLFVKVEVPIGNIDKIFMSIIRDGIAYEEEHVNTYNFGPIKAVIYFFGQGDKKRFHSRLGVTVKDFGNIRLYMDSFRIYPYGESLNDWLDLDIRKAQGFARFFGSRDLVGYVQVYKNHNKCFIPTTNRQGLIENDSTKELRNFIIDYPIKVLEKFFFKKPKNEIFQQSKQNVENAVIELKKVASQVQKTSPQTARLIRHISGVVQQSQADQTEFVRNQEELLNVYKRVASKEILLHEIIHQALIRIKNIKSLCSHGKRRLTNYNSELSSSLLDDLAKTFEDIDIISNDAKEYLWQARNHLIRDKKKEYCDLKLFTEQVLLTFSGSFQEENIDFKLDISESIHYSIDKNDLQILIENFINNSLKSLRNISNRQRKIYIRIFQTPRHVIFIFKDNGVGIPEHLRDRIFDPFFTTTPDGFGMGLAIVDEIVKGYNGELNLALNDDQGAEFHIKLKK